MQLFIFSKENIKRKEKHFLCSINLKIIKILLEILHVFSSFNGHTQKH